MRLHVRQPAISLRRVTFALFAALLGIAILGCNLPSLLSARDNLASAMTMEQALSTPPEDHRQGILSQLGPPSTFCIMFQELDGQIVREEEWSYLGDGIRLVFVDGTLVLEDEIEPADDPTLTAALYDPLVFRVNMTPADVAALFPEQELTAVDLAEADMSGAVAMAGDQILLGFEGEDLVYVQTFALIPEVTP